MMLPQQSMQIDGSAPWLKPAHVSNGVGARAEQDAGCAFAYTSQRCSENILSQCIVCSQWFCVRHAGPCWGCDITCCRGCFTRHKCPPIPIANTSATTTPPEELCLPSSEGAENGNKGDTPRSCSPVLAHTDSESEYIIPAQRTPIRESEPSQAPVLMPVAATPAPVPAVAGTSKPVQPTCVGDWQRGVHTVTTRAGLPLCRNPCISTVSDAQLDFNENFHVVNVIQDPQEPGSCWARVYKGSPNWCLLENDGVMHARRIDQQPERCP